MAKEFVTKAKQDPAVGGISTSFRVTAPRLYAEVNRDRAKALGVPISEVFDTMQACDQAPTKLPNPYCARFLATRCPEGSAK